MLFLTAGEVDHLASVIGPLFYALIVFATFTGLHACKCATLKWERIDLPRSTVEVPESAAELGGRLEVVPTTTLRTTVGPDAGIRP